MIIKLLVILLVGRLFLGIYRHFLRPAKNLRKYGEWAVVTGATDGIGKEIAIELAKKRLNVVLIARNEEKLNEVRENISKTYSVQVKQVKVDFAKFDEKSKDAVRAALKELDIGVLVNNVGMSYPHPNYFEAIGNDMVDQLHALNINSTVSMTQMVLPGMKIRRRGAIVNVSSASSLLPAPLLAVYSASKAYVDKFSLALHHEYARDGIRVQVQNPLYVSSKLSKIRNSSLTVPSPKTYAKVAVRAIGYEAQISPYWPHALQLFVQGFLPDFVLGKMCLSMHIPILKKALKKQNQNSS